MRFLVFAIDEAHDAKKLQIDEIDRQVVAVFHHDGGDAARDRVEDIVGPFGLGFGSSRFFLLLEVSGRDIGLNHEHRFFVTRKIGMGDFAAHIRLGVAGIVATDAEIEVLAFCQFFFDFFRARIEPIEGPVFLGNPAIHGKFTGLVEVESLA